MLIKLDANIFSILVTLSKQNIKLLIKSIQCLADDHTVTVLKDRHEDKPGLVLVAWPFYNHHQHFSSEGLKSNSLTAK